MRTFTNDRLGTMQKIDYAKACGFEPRACTECQNFTLVRERTTLKCSTCGTESEDENSHPVLPMEDAINL